jgi:hypothetical protein
MVVENERISNQRKIKSISASHVNIHIPENNISNTIYSMASSKKLYVGEYLAKGTYKTVFNVVEHILPDGVQNEEINLTPQYLEKIYIIVNPDVDVNDVVVSRIPLYIDNYERNIENINLHLMFASMNSAPQIYGVVFVAESTDHNGIQHIETNQISISPGIHIGNPYEPINYREENINVFIFQERCIMDLKKQMSTAVLNIKNDAIPESAIESMIFNHLDDSISRYVDEMEIIELDYNTGNVCIQKIDGSQKYIWTSFDFDTVFTRSFRSLPLTLKRNFAYFAKIYMILLMMITISYSFREPRRASTGSASSNAKIQKIKNIISEKLTSVYHISFNTIVEMLIFFDDYKPGKKYWDYEIFTRSYNPENTLTHYAGEYFVTNFHQRRSSDVLPEHIQEVYNQYPSAKTKVATLVCSILGLELGGGESLSKTMRLGGKRKKSKKSILTKKHLNKRASTYTNARTKKSNTK